MKVQCPNCSFTSQIDDAKVPDKEVKIRCPKCSTRFPIKKEADTPIAAKKSAEKPQKHPKPKDADKPAASENDGGEAAMVQCPKCRHRQHSRAACVYCGTAFPDYVPPAEPAPAPSPVPKASEPLHRSRATVESPLMSRERERDAEEAGDAELIRCPYCDERIREKAVKCKHCHERLDSSAPGAGRPRVQSPVEALKGLIDFSFSRYITPALIKILYGAALAIGGILTIAGVVIGILRGEILGALAGILLFVLYLLSLRAYAEILLVFFDIENNTRQ